MQWINNSLSVIDVLTNAIVGSPIPVGVYPLFIAFADPNPPTNFSGILRTNTFFTQTAYINNLSWDPPLNSSQVSSYRIYRNQDLTDLAGEVPASEPLVFVDQGRAGQTAVYYLVAVYASGAESAPAITRVP